MCGDGANDCSALKVADAGISLSEAEASIAAPFTSRIQDISCVITLLREGRAALTTSFQCFKFMELYSMIQFINVTLLYFNGGNLTDYQFLYVDLIVLTPLAIFMGHTEPYSKLTPHLPSKSLLSLPVLFSIIGQVLIQLCFQLFVFYWVQYQGFYKEFVYDPEREDNESSYENSAVYLVSVYQYLITCVAFSISKPFRKPLYTNAWFSISLVLLLVFNLLFTLINSNTEDDPTWF